MPLNREDARRLALANGMARCALGVLAMTVPSVAAGAVDRPGR